MLSKINKTSTKEMCKHSTKRKRIEITKHEHHGTKYIRNNKTT
jgi:hypothetical protein